MDEPSICRANKNLSSPFKLCINCSTTLTPGFNECQVSQMENDTQTVSTHLTTKTVFSVFQLHYLKAFESLPEWTDDESTESGFSALCPNCSQIFNSLYDIYKKLEMMKNEFLQLRNLDSYLSKILARLDEIIDCHQQRTIKCDLIKINTEDQQEKDSNIVEPRVVLTRLSEKYTKLSTVIREKCEIEDEECDGDEPTNSPFVSSSDEEVDLSTIKMELDLDDPHLSSPFSSTDQEDDDSSQANITVKSENDEVDPLSLVETVRDVETTEIFAGSCKRPPVANHSPLKPLKPSTKSKHSVRNISKKTPNLLGSSSTLLQHDKNFDVDLQEKANETEEQSEIEVISQQSSMTRTRSGHLETIVTEGSNQTSKSKTDTSIDPTTYLSRRKKHANPCWHCHSHFPTPEECLEHTKNEHFDEFLEYSSDAIICKTCAKICRNYRSLISHENFCKSIPKDFSKDQSSPRMYQCDRCSSLLPTRRDLDAHRKIHKDDRPFSCSSCPYKTKTPSELKSHVMRRHTPKEVIRTDNVEKVFCDVCGSAFKDKFTLKSHQYNLHSEEGRQAYKEKLEKINIKKKMERAKVPKLSTSCDDCGIDLYSRLALINHRMSVHADNMGRSFICDQCGRAFSSQSRLNSHIKNVHTEDRSFICHLCGKPQKTKNNLRVHLIRSHTEEGRRKFNQETREKNQRRKQRESLLAQLNEEKSNSSGQKQMNKDQMKKKNEKYCR